MILGIMSRYYAVVYGSSLAHHGILGMRWGVWNAETRARYEGAKSSLDASEKITRAVRDKKDAKRKNLIESRSQNRYDKRQVLTQEQIDNMSTQELKELVNRMNLETQYSKLTAKKGSDDLDKLNRTLKNLDIALDVLSVISVLFTLYKMTDHGDDK